MPYLNFRWINALLLLGAVVGMAFALYLQYGPARLDPCPLCVFQRVGLMGMGLFALIGTLWVPARLWVRRLLATLGLLSIGWATAVAGRHVWLQHLPPEDVPACGPGLDYWMDTFPMKEVIQKVLHGSGECAKVDWTFLGWSLPHWSLVFFVGLLLISLVQVVRRSR